MSALGEGICYYVVAFRRPTVPSQKQIKWSQLRVGLTVVFASITLGVLIFLMSGTTGLFTKKIMLKSYFDNSGGLRVGAPVRLQGVDIGNVTSIRLVQDKPLTPVEVLMKVSTKDGCRSQIKELKDILVRHLQSRIALGAYRERRAGS